MSGADLDAIVALARAAGREIMRVYAGAFDTVRKADGSPVTAADHAAEALIVAGLAKLDPGVPILSEEMVSAGQVPDVADRTFWCVDPLDGTKEFIARTDEFVVCIARIEHRTPVLGVVHAPVQDATYAGAGAGTAAATAFKVDAAGTRHAIAVRAVPTDGAVALDSRSHRDGAELDGWLARHNVRERRICGSALKFGLVAEGTADLYARFGPTSEWDTAAGHAVLEAAGGSVTTLDGGVLRYAKPRFLNGGFIARGRA